MARKNKKKKTLAFKNAVAGYLFIAPFIIGFILLGIVNQGLGLSRFGDIFNLIYWIAGCLLYVALAYKLLCMVKSPQKVYIVDMEDPTVLERKKRGHK